jgi:hypothetical protein
MLIMGLVAFIGRVTSWWYQRQPPSPSQKSHHKRPHILLDKVIIV